MAFSLFWSMVIMKNLGIKCYILSYSVKVSEAVAIVPVNGGIIDIGQGPVLWIVKKPDILI